MRGDEYVLPVAAAAVDDDTPVSGLVVSHGAEGKGLSRESLEAMVVPELKVLLRERGLKVSGRKAELIERMLEV